MKYFLPSQISIASLVLRATPPNEPLVGEGRT